MDAHSKELFREIVCLRQARKHCVLATIVDTRGSTPAKQGSRLLIRHDGSTLGTIGGGCVEAEVWQEAMDAMSSRRAYVREFVLDDDLAAESGLVCGGTLRIMIDATVNGQGALRFFAQLLDNLEHGNVTALATLVRSASRSVDVGAKALMTKDGQPLAAFPQTAGGFLAGGPAPLADLEEGPRLAASAGAEWFVERIGSTDTIVVAGAGHIAKAVSSMAKILGFRVVVVDDREAFASRQRFPEADEVIAAPIAETIQRFTLSFDTFVVVATRGHKEDYEVLRAIVGKPAAYIGMIGSRRKVELIHRKLAADGVSPEALKRVHAPVGLDIGAGTPEEIALSIMAEIVMVKSGGDGAPLMGRRGAAGGRTSP